MAKLSDKDFAKLISELPKDILKEVLLESTKDMPKVEVSAYKQFKDKYFKDFAGFLVDCVDWLDREPAMYQLEIARDVLLHERYTIRGPRGMGKTAIAALLILFYSLTRDGLDWKIPTTASNWKQLRDFLWPEIHKWARRLKWDVIGREPFNNNEMLEHNLKLSTGRAFSITSNRKAGDEGASMEGSHADYMLYVFDEAKEIPDTVFDSVEGSFTSGTERILFVISSPGAQMGRFYDIHSRAKGYEEWAVRHVTKNEAIKAGQMLESWVESRKNQWGALNFRYLNQVLGEFAADSTRGIIPLSFVSRANILYTDWLDRINYHPTPAYIGCDVATKNDDAVLAFYVLPVIDKLLGLVEPLLHKNLSANNTNKVQELLNSIKLEEYLETTKFITILKEILKNEPNSDGLMDDIEILLRPYKDVAALNMGGISKTEVILKLNPELATMQIANLLQSYLDKYHSCIVSLDSIGIGGGVANRLNEIGYGDRTIAFDVREKTYYRSRDNKTFFNKRSAIWVLGADILHPEFGDNIFLPPVDNLIAELTALQEIDHTTPNMIKVERKEQVKKRLHRSTDTADAVLMALFGNILSGTSSDSSVLDLAQYMRDNM